MERSMLGSMRYRLTKAAYAFKAGRTLFALRDIWRCAHHAVAFGLSYDCLYAQSMADDTSHRL